MKIAILGATGQLGQDLVRVCHEFKLYPLGHEQIDITKPASLKKVFEEIAPDIVVNCAAWTDVPGCEKHAAKAFDINAVAAHHVALACHSVQAKLVHISTDYVFNGETHQPYTELSLPGPVNIYGLSKLTGEYYVRMAHDRVFIVRTSGLFGIHPCRGKKANFVETMLQMAKTQDVVKVVEDEVLTPTFTLHLAQQIRVLMQTEYYGLYHATAQGACSWFDFTRKIFELSKINTRLEKTTVKEFSSPVRRPSYSVLKNLNLQNHGIDFMKFWDEGLQDYFLDKENKLSI